MYLTSIKEVTSKAGKTFYMVGIAQEYRSDKGGTRRGFWVKEYFIRQDLYKELCKTYKGNIAEVVVTASLGGGIDNIQII